MKAVTLKYTVQTVNEWRAGYSESCKSGSGASVRKPTAAMRQGAGYLAYAYTTEETEKLEVYRHADMLGGDIELAIKQLTENKPK